MYNPYIGEVNEILSYSDLFDEPIPDLKEEIKKLNSWKALSVISELLSVRNMTVPISTVAPVIGRIEMDVPYQLYLKKEFCGLHPENANEMYEDIRLKKNKHIIALQPMLILTKYIIAYADAFSDIKTDFTVSKDDYISIVKLELIVSEMLRARDLEKFSASNFLYGTYHINYDHNVGAEFLRSYFIFEKAGKKVEDFEDDIKGEFRDYWSSFFETYGYTIRDYLFSLFWELRRYFGSDSYLSYNTLWENTENAYKDTKMASIAPRVIKDLGVKLTDLREWCENTLDEVWNFKGFLEHPFLISEDEKVLSISEYTLKNSFFEKLFWKIRDCYPDDEDRIMSFYGRLYEAYIQKNIEDVISRQNKYTYVKEFKYGRKNGSKSSDAYIKLGKKMLAIEAKGFSVLFNCIVEKSVDANLEKLFVKPILQADKAYNNNVSREVFEDVEELYVVSVTMDSINAVPEYYEKCKSIIEEKRKSSEMKAYYNLNIEELEMLLFMIEKEYDIFEMLDSYFGEKYLMPFSNYINKFCPQKVEMTSYMKEIYEEAAAEMKKAYGIE